MEELKNILLEHAARYRAMRPTDAVKLIYQNEFGGGHLVRDEAACLDYLRREYGSTRKDPGIPLYENIGNGIVRVNLAALPESGLEKLGQDFIRSAARHRGNADSFRKKLSVLMALTVEGAFCFTPEELGAYLAEYEKAGYPMVSHSPEYRHAYRPAYRIICVPKDCAHHFNVSEERTTYPRE